VNVVNLLNVAKDSSNKTLPSVLWNDVGAEESIPVKLRCVQRKKKRKKKISYDPAQKHKKDKFSDIRKHASLVFFMSSLYSSSVYLSS
jgi:hypothetical protein